MKRIQLDQTRLLGFRIVASQPVTAGDRNAQAPRQPLNPLLGAKVGVKSGPKR